MKENLLEFTITYINYYDSNSDPKRECLHNNIFVRQLQATLYNHHQRQVYSHGL